MRIVELSNHPGVMLQEAHDRHTLVHGRAQARFDQESARHRKRTRQARAARDKARAQRRWLRWLRLTFAAWRLRRYEPGCQARVLTLIAFHALLVTTRLTRAAASSSENSAAISR